MITIKGILGNIKNDTALRETCDRLSEQGKLERVLIEPRETGKSRLRKNTDKGTDVGIVMERGTALVDGDVLHIDDPERAVIVEVKPEEAMVITLDPVPTRGELIANAVRLGHILGNQHWPVKAEGETICVPVSIDPKVMETVLKTYHAEGIRYEFKQIKIEDIPQREHHHEHP